MTKRDKYYHLLDQYVSGNLSTQERHDLEKKALDDPFFFDAMEGWVKMGNADHAVHIDRLQKKINRKSQTSLAKRILWPVAIAASLLLMFTIGNILVNNDDSTLASVTPVEKDEIPVPAIADEDENLKEEIASDEPIVNSDETPTPNTDVAYEPQPPPPAKEKPLTIEKERKNSSTGSRDMASSDVEGIEEVTAFDAEENESSPVVKVEPPKRMPLSNINESLLNNSTRADMSQKVGVIEILDADLNNHIKQNLFMRAMKVPTGQKFSFDLTFNSSLTLTEIKIVSESNELCENIKEFIESYKSWKKETIPPNLFGRYNYPTK